MHRVGQAMTDRLQTHVSKTHRSAPPELPGSSRSPDPVIIELPPGEPIWLVMLATLCGMILPAGAAIAAVELLGPPNVPHSSHLAVLAAAALTLAEAIFAGLGVGALLEAAWRGVRLPGPGPADYLPLRWARRRRARRNLIALSRRIAPRRAAHRGRAGHIWDLCYDVGHRLGMSDADCDRATGVALTFRDARDVGPPATAAGLAGGDGRSVRLGAVVETYDALVFGRADDPGVAREDVFAELREMRLHPDVVEALIEVETERGSLAGRLTGLPLLGGLVASLSGPLRHGRYFVRTSATPSAAGATFLAIIVAGLFGFLPALDSGVLTLRTSGPVVVDATPTPTDSVFPTAGPSDQPSSLLPPSTVPAGIATGTQRVPLYFPSQVPHRVLTTPIPGVLPTVASTVSSPTAVQSPAVIYVTQFPETPPPGSPTPTPVATPPPTPPPPVVPVADKVVSANMAGALPALTSPPLTTSSGNELVLAIVSADGPATGAQSISTVAGGGLTWSLAARENAELGTAEVWQAFAGAPLVNASVVATLASAGYGGSITVATFTGAASAVGHTAVGAAATGPPAVTVTTTKPGSLVWFVGHDGSRAVARTPLGGQTIVHEFLDTAAGHSSWVQATGQVAVSNSVVTAGDSTPILDRWDIAAVEIASSQ